MVGVQTLSQPRLVLDQSDGFKIRLNKPSDYDLIIQREWLAQSDKLDVEKAMSQSINFDISYPWDTGANALSKDELEKETNGNHYL